MAKRTSLTKTITTIGDLGKTLIPASRSGVPVTLEPKKYVFVWNAISGWSKEKLDTLPMYQRSPLHYIVATEAEFKLVQAGESGKAAIDNLAIVGALDYMSIRYQADTPTVKLADVLSMSAQLKMALSSAYKGEVFSAIGKSLLTATLDFALENSKDTEIKSAYDLLSTCLKEQGIISTNYQVKITKEHIEQAFKMSHALGNVNPSNQNLLSGNI